MKILCVEKCSVIVLAHLFFSLNKDKVIYHQKSNLKGNDFSFKKFIK